MSFVQQEWFLVWSMARTVATVIKLPSKMGAVWVPRGRQHLSAVVVGGVREHVLESVCLSQQQSNLLKDQASAIP